MSSTNPITLLYKLPHNCLKEITKDCFQLTLPVQSHICPSCQTPTSKIHSYRNQKVKSAIFYTCGQTLVYRKRRYICSHCGKVFAENNTFISRYQRMTQNTIKQIISEHSNITSSSDIARRYGVSTPTVQRLFKFVNPSSMLLSEVISIDEFKGNTGAKFQVVINDLEKRQCLNILQDRALDNLYKDISKYPLKERLKVKHVSIDLSSFFRKVVTICFPNATIAADKFHTARLANDALDEVRKRIQKSLPDEQRKYFKKSRYLMLSREKNLNEEDRLALQIILNYSDELSAAYAMKEVFFNMLDSKNSTIFSKCFRQFQEAVEKQNRKEFNRVLKTTRQWKKEILHGIVTGFNNGFTEGCNTTIKNLKRICYGYRNFDNFKRRILFLLNSPDRKKRRLISTQKIST